MNPEIQNVIEFIIYSLSEVSIVKRNLENINPGKWQSKTYYQL